MNSRRLHSITSSARASSVGGTSRPSALAVLRLIDQLVLGRRLHWKVGRLLALEDAIDVARRASVLVDDIGPVGNQAAASDEGAIGIDGGQSVPGRERRRSARDDRSPTRTRHDQTAIGSRANAATARSISPASRTSTGLTSIPSDGATAWITANWPIPRCGWIPKDCRSRHARRDLLEQLQPFPAHAVFKLHKTGGVAARPRQDFRRSRRRPDR